jgi:hypothetical protein
VNKEYTVFVASLFWSATSLASTQSSDENICKSYESEIASCSLKGKSKKIASICVSKKTKQVAYYFGTKQKIELEVKFSSDHVLYRWVDPGSYVTFLGFNQDGYSYVIGVPQETYSARAMLIVKDSKRLIDFNHYSLCLRNSFGQKEWVGEGVQDVYGREGDFLFPPISTKKDGSE